MILVFRIALGVAFLLFLPGYSLVGALYPRKSDLGDLERLGLAVGVSIAIAASIAALLNSLPWGIQLGSVATSVGLVVLLASAAAWYRIRNLPREIRFLDFGSSRSRQLPSWRPLASVLLVILVAMIFGIGAYLTIQTESRSEFTQFYIVGVSGEDGGYPRAITTGQPVTLMICVANYEHDDVQYRIEVESGTSWEQIASMQLGHEESWEQPYTFTLSEPGENRKVSFLLYKGDDPEPYRSLHLWITVREEP